MGDYDPLWLRSAARLIHAPLRLIARQPFAPPHRALIIKGGSLSDVMLATPLLASLHKAYPKARFDWAVNPEGRAAVFSNKRLAEVIDSGQVGLAPTPWHEVQALIERLRSMEYDTCFILAPSSLLSLIAWRAGIKQRIGLSRWGSGLALTSFVGLSKNPHRAERYLALARSAGINSAPKALFEAPDQARDTIVRLLLEELGWQHDAPLVILHPGGGNRPGGAGAIKHWPAERFALLGNHLARTYGACILLVGAQADQEAAEDVAGMLAVNCHNLAGRLNLGELGALCEIADLYTGNDTGPTHIAAAVGCPTVAIFGPTDPDVWAPVDNGTLRVVQPADRPSGSFTWDNCLPASKVIAAADELMAASQP